MNKQTYEELVKFFESKNLSEVASGLKKDLKGLVQPKVATAQSNKENQDQVLMIIRKAIKSHDQKSRQEEIKEAVGNLKHPLP